MNHTTAIGMAAIVALATFAPFSQAEHQPSVKLLTATFAAREVVKVEVGDFHFTPGQIAPIHTHAAPAIGYVAKGSILYQVDGERPRLLTEGDAFFEPVGPRILRFDNASATEEAIFVDFNLQQEGEPFIVFAEPLKEAIDRRTLPTVELQKHSVKQVDVYSTDLLPLEKQVLQTSRPTFGLVAEGVVNVASAGSDVQRVAAGQSFAVVDSGSATIVNASAEAPASVITFELH